MARVAARGADLYRGHDPRDLPAYTTSEAAQYIRVPENTVRTWAFGRHFNSAAGPRFTPALIVPADTKNNLLSFNNLTELHVVSALRKNDVQMLRVRDAIEYLVQRLDSPRPLLQEQMLTDGAYIFVTKFGELINASQSGQLAMRALLEAYLRRIERDARGLPIRLFPFTTPPRVVPLPGIVTPPENAARLISIDSRVAFGRPVIAGSRIPTAEVFARFQAGDTIADLASDYDRQAEEIEAAIRWESTATAA